MLNKVPCRPGLGGVILPRSCEHIPQVDVISSLDSWDILSLKYVIISTCMHLLTLSQQIKSAEVLNILILICSFLSN